MELEKYTERSRGFIQSAFSFAKNAGHQQLTPLHILKVFLDDKEGQASILINKAGGNPKLGLESVHEELSKLPKVKGPGSGQVYLSQEAKSLFDQAEQIAEKSGDDFVSVEKILLAIFFASCATRKLCKNRDLLSNCSKVTRIDSELIIRIGLRV